MIAESIFFKASAASDMHRVRKLFLTDVISGISSLSGHQGGAADYLLKRSPHIRCRHFGMYRVVYLVGTKKVVVLSVSGVFMR
ncbi:MAG: hypothetical protein JWN38_75 [Candidatus Saccharibacteria bacterium]|nr:hypothetical protein [Candidatus Saccharibacteria bacterium]